MIHHSSVRISRIAKRRIELVLAPGTVFVGYTVRAIRSGRYKNLSQETVEIELTGSDGKEYVWDIYSKHLFLGKQAITNVPPDFLHNWHAKPGSEIQPT